MDDEEYRHAAMKKNAVDATICHAWNAKQAIALLQKNTYDLIMLDHDLVDFPNSGDSQYDGSYVSRILATMEKHRQTPVVIHSLNPPGSAYMESTLRSAGYVSVAKIPFAWLYIFRKPDGSWEFDRSRAPCPLALEDMQPNDGEPWNDPNFMRAYPTR